jgi:uncharacterized membrane protein
MAMTDLFHTDTSFIEDAIKKAEKKTSAEIRVFIEPHCREIILDRTAYIFFKLKMNETQLRNGVLIYIASKDRQCAIMGDRGITAHVGKDFWQSVVNELTGHFANGKMKEGIEHAIDRIATEMAIHFPCQPGDVNELPDEVVTGQ